MKKVLFILLLLPFISPDLNAQEIMLLKTSGKVVIGDTSQISTPGTYNLYVQNGILTEKVKVALRDASEWSDNAFQNVPTLDQMENSILTNSHLKGMPSADHLVENGYEVTGMDAKLLAQIEWLWQHTIALNKENESLKKELDLIKAKLED